MIKETLAKVQPIVYQTLKKALEEDKLSHAYLFHGASGTMKREAAILLAQSLVCTERNPFACEVCDTCVRILNNQYADIIFLDGSKNSIKKNQIKDLQQQFNKTGLEMFNQKVYILNEAENATPEALNSLLKFLEEPSGSSITAILLVEQLDRLLPTIVSRCQVIPFKAMSQQESYRQALEKGMDDLDAYLLSNCSYNPEQMLEIEETNSYQEAIKLFRGFIQNLVYNVDMCLTRLQIEGFTSKNREEQREVLHYLFDFSVVFFKDMDKENSNTDEWWQKHLTLYREKRVNNQAILQSLLEGKDRLNRFVNVPLLVDQVFFEIKEVL